MFFSVSVNIAIASSFEINLPCLLHSMRSESEFSFSVGFALEIFPTVFAKSRLRLFPMKAYFVVINVTGQLLLTGYILVAILLTVKAQLGGYREYSTKLKNLLSSLCDVVDHIGFGRR